MFDQAESFVTADGRTIGAKHGDEKKLRNYVKNQGSGKPSYKAFQHKQLKLFG